MQDRFSAGFFAKAQLQRPLSLRLKQSPSFRRHSSQFIETSEVINKVAISVLISVACLTGGCQPTSGGESPEPAPNQTPQVPTSGRSPSNGHPGSSSGSNPFPKLDSSCLRASCGDNFLHHLSESQLLQMTESLQRAAHSELNKNKKIVQEAAVLGGELKSIFPQLDFSDPKTQECALWLLERIRKVIEKNEDISNMKAEIQAFETT